MSKKPGNRNRGGRGEEKDREFISLEDLASGYVSEGPSEYDYKKLAKMVARELRKSKRRDSDSDDSSVYSDSSSSTVSSVGEKMSTTEIVIRVILAVVIVAAGLSILLAPQITLPLWGTLLFFAKVAIPTIGGYIGGTMVSNVWKNYAFYHPNSRLVRAYNWFVGKVAVLKEMSRFWGVREEDKKMIAGAARVGLGALGAKLPRGARRKITRVSNVAKNLENAEAPSSEAPREQKSKVNKESKSSKKNGASQSNKPQSKNINKAAQEQWNNINELKAFKDKVKRQGENLQKSIPKPVERVERKNDNQSTNKKPTKERKKVDQVAREGVSTAKQAKEYIKNGAGSTIESPVKKGEAVIGRK